ncbi:MAG: adenine-specific methyltransferase EcoRI family protein [Gammaproteobacteria bacterium]|nr:adenine-specific methyltransferase EcoRI family protein [Gammaproteobacteria bacterium]MCY4276030.1 adenine-specific methyltransferase EcoRI family protein [Gammaproteobacteria bacterium]
MARHHCCVGCVTPDEGYKLLGKGNLNADLHKAARNRNDDFYTQLSDIAEEMRHYAIHFRDKVVYCNCDDPTASQFFQYFYKKFRSLGLRKLITTCYKNRNTDLFTLYDQKRAAGITFTESVDDDEMPDIKIFYLEGDGDFRSEECIRLLKQADIVVTNPPFSLFREYVAQLVENGKRFLIIGSMNAVTYKEIFPLIKDNRLWYGPSISSGDREFGIPDHYPLTAATHRTDASGRKFVRVKGVRWFTNLDHKKRHEELILGRKYTPEDYPKYDNYDAINVDKVADIPEDYPDAMGVPITFLDKYNPDQFEILSCNDIRLSDRVPIKGHGLIKDKDSSINGKPKYVRIVIRNRQL